MRASRTASAARLVAPADPSPRGRRASVRPDELRVARAAVAKLPAADRALLARLGLRVQLVPSRGLEDGMLGATSIVRGRDGRWSPTAIRVASRIEGRGPGSLGEVVQHEVGHALAVLRRQDRSEDAAHAYARRW